MYVDGPLESRTHAAFFGVQRMRESRHGIARPLAMDTTRLITLKTLASWIMALVSPKKHAMCTEDSYSYTGNNGTCSTSYCTVGLTLGCVTVFKVMFINSVAALMTALAQPPVSVSIGAECYFFDCILAVSCSSGTARTSTSKFLRSVMVLIAAQIVGSFQDHYVKVYDGTFVESSCSEIFKRYVDSTYSSNARNLSFLLMVTQFADLKDSEFMP